MTLPNKHSSLLAYKGVGGWGDAWTQTRINTAGLSSQLYLKYMFKFQTVHRQNEIPLRLLMHKNLRQKHKSRRLARQNNAFQAWVI